MFSVEIPELMDGWMIWKQIPRSIAVFVFEHLRVCRGQAVLLPGVVELIERPSDILLILRQRHILFLRQRSKCGQTLVDQIPAQIAPDGLFADIAAGGNPGNRFTSESVIPKEGQNACNQGISLMCYSLLFRG